MLKLYLICDISIESNTETEVTSTGAEGTGVGVGDGHVPVAIGPGLKPAFLAALTFEKHTSPLLLWYNLELLLAMMEGQGTGLFCARAGREIATERIHTFSTMRKCEILIFIPLNHL